LQKEQNMSEFGFGAATQVADEEIPQDLQGIDESFQYDGDEPSGGGNFPPRITPGWVRFRVSEIKDYKERANDNADAKKRSVHILSNGTVPQITYTAQLQVADLRERPGRLLRPIEGAEERVSFNRASGHKTAGMAEKRVKTALEELHGGLGFSADLGPPRSFDEMVERIRNGAVGRFAEGHVRWEAGFKNADGSYTTFVTGKPGPKDKAWPAIGADGVLPTEVTHNGETKTAQLRIDRVYTPKPPKVAA
jgi:hypothetical protein